MKKSIKSLFVLVGLAVLISACEGQGDALINERLENNPIQTFEVTSGSTDFTTFIAIGNSLTAGFMDGALYNAGQEASIGNMLAQQVGTTVPDFTFNQPDINSVNGFNALITNPVGTTIFGRFKLDTSIPGPSPVVNGEAASAYSGPQIHNFGVPGIQVGQLLIPETGGPESELNPAFSPYYQRFASNPGSSTILGDAVATQPTFFSLWIGNNDVLGYANSGASNEAILTSDEDFQTRFGAVINTLMTNTSADGLVIDIPFILALPAFQAVRWNNITLDANTAAFLNSNFQAVNGAIQGCANVGVDQADIDRRMISYAEGNNPILVIDEELDDLGGCFDALMGAGAISEQQRASLVPFEQSRPMVEGELVLFSAASVLGTEADGDNSAADTPIGVAVPLGFSLADGSLSGDRYYLSLAEQVIIETKRQTFNAMIQAIIAPYSDRIAFYNTNDPSSAFMDLFGLSDGAPGITVGGVDYAPDFSPNGVMSTDGVHPNPRGNAIIVNEMLEVIEAKFGSNLPSVSVVSEPSVALCAGDCLSQQ